MYSANGTNKVVPPIKVVVADSKENEDVAIKVSYFHLSLILFSFYSSLSSDFRRRWWHQAFTLPKSIFYSTHVINIDQHNPR